MSMEDMTVECETLIIPTADGTEKEFAIVDRFTMDGAEYVVVAEVIGDEISEEGVYIYGAVENGDDIEVTQLDEETYNKAAAFYSEQ